jgi:formylglycine-generating enzyme required for sulfatase activity
MSKWLEGTEEAAFKPVAGGYVLQLPGRWFIGRSQHFLGSRLWWYGRTAGDGYGNGHHRTLPDTWGGMRSLVIACLISCGVAGLWASLVSARVAAQPLTADQERGLKPADVFRECDDCPEMVVVPAGSFVMGSPADESGRKGDEGPQHPVTIRRPFAIAKFETKIDQFQAFVRETAYDAGSRCLTWEDGKVEERAGRSWSNPGFSQNGAHPVTCLSWADAKAYVAWLSRKLGKDYRLLTEAEGEFGARAGTMSRFYFGNDATPLCRYANGLDLTASSAIAGVDPRGAGTCSDGYAYTAPVGSFAANGFGLHDMLGNVQEWVEDCSHENYNAAPADGSAWISGDCGHRVVRGGSWASPAAFLRSANRNVSTPPGVRLNVIGVRVARTLAASN